MYQFLIIAYLFTLDIFDLSVLGLIHDQGAVPRIADDLHRVGDDGRVRVYVSLSTSVAHLLDKLSKAMLLLELDDLVDVAHHQTVFQVPLQERRGE